MCSENVPRHIIFLLWNQLPSQISCHLGISHCCDMCVREINDKHLRIIVGTYLKQCCCNMQIHNSFTQSRTWHNVFELAHFISAWCHDELIFYLNMKLSRANIYQNGVAYVHKREQCLCICDKGVWKGLYKGINVSHLPVDKLIYADYSSFASVSIWICVTFYKNLKLHLLKVITRLHSILKIISYHSTLLKAW